MTRHRLDPSPTSAFLDALLAAPVPAARVDETGRIADVNAAWLARFGGAREGYLGEVPAGVVAAHVPLSFATLPDGLGGAELVYAPAAGADGGDIPGVVAFDTTGMTGTDPGWVTVTVSLPSSWTPYSTTALGFRDLASDGVSYYGPALDEVSVVER